MCFDSAPGWTQCPGWTWGKGGDGRQGASGVPIGPTAAPAFSLAGSLATAPDRPPSDRPRGWGAGALVLPALRPQGCLLPPHKPSGPQDLALAPLSRLGSPQPGSLCPSSFQAALCYHLCVSQPAPAPSAAPGPGGTAQTQPPTVRLPWTNSTAGPRLPVSTSAGSPAHLTLQP